MECSCKTCTEACSWNPGWFLPGEIEQLAKFLDCSVQELFNTYLCADYWIEDVGETYVISPLTVKDQHRAGGIASFSRFGSPCIFLHRGLCSIHEVKPDECRWFDHTRTPKESSKKHESVKEAWKDHQNQIEQLLKGNCDDSQSQ